MEKKPTWIVLANSSSARIFAKKNGNHHLSLVKEMTHPESRKKARELVSDGSGRYKAGTFATGVYSPRTEPKKVEAEHFALQLAEFLEQSHNSHDYQSLILIIPPPFQALVKEHLSSTVHQAVEETLSKDYHDYSQKDLEDVLNQK